MLPHVLVAEQPGPAVVLDTACLSQPSSAHSFTVGSSPCCRMCLRQYCMPPVALCCACLSQPSSAHRLLAGSRPCCRMWAWQYGLAPAVVLGCTCLSQPTSAHRFAAGLRPSCCRWVGQRSVVPALLRTANLPHPSTSQSARALLDAADDAPNSLKGVIQRMPLLLLLLLLLVLLVSLLLLLLSPASLLTGVLSVANHCTCCGAALGTC
jgi:hypothetical protein